MDKISSEQPNCTDAISILRGQQHLRRRRIHEIEPKQIIDPHRLEHQDRVRQIPPLDLGYRVWHHLVSVRRLDVETITITLARARASGRTRTLASLGLRDGHDDERVHAKLGVVRVLLSEAGVDDIVDPVDGQTSLRDVGCNDGFACARGCRFEYEGGVDGEDNEIWYLGPSAFMSSKRISHAASTSS